MKQKFFTIIVLMATIKVHVHEVDLSDIEGQPGVCKATISINDGRVLTDISLNAADAEELFNNLEEGKQDYNPSLGSPVDPSTIPAVGATTPATQAAAGE